MAAKLTVTKDLTNNVYSNTFEVTDITIAEGELIQDFGEPTVTFGGTFDQTDQDMLEEFFPNDPDLIPDWVEFREYTTGDEVQFTDEIFYVALQDVEFDSDTNFTDWV